VDLAALLVAMGAAIRGAGSDVIEIDGRDRLHAAAHRVLADRIEAGTYLVAGALAGDDVEVAGCPVEALRPVLDQLARAGVPLDTSGANVRVRATDRLAAADVETAPHPGFPTDMQAQYMALMTQAHGTSRISERIFEQRFMHVHELQRMGARIRVAGQTAEVSGPAALTGAQVMATDLRASASLVLAALVARGATVVDRIYHLDRGYEKMEHKLGRLGAEVERIR
jgi:UDP-N-acetylglucosamine 1-carboxyvinyltransferase